jgi:SAM-dependent methyltransferase
MFAEVARVVRPGGSFYLSTPYRSFVGTALDPAWWLIGHRHYTKEVLVALAQKHGFTVELFEVRGKMFVILNTLNLYFSKWILRRERLFSSYFDTKDTMEYFQKGYVNIFMKMTKV